MSELTLCNAGQGNKPKTHCDISSLLSIPLLSVESIHMDRVEKEREKDSARAKGEKAKTARTRKSLHNANALYKEQSKSMRHKILKVPTKESAQIRKRHPCSKCGQDGHTKSDAQEM